MSDEFVALIQAELDSSSLEKELSNLKPSTPIKVKVDTSDIKKQIESVLSNISVKGSKIDLSNLVNTGSIQKQAQNVGVQISNGIQNSVSKTLKPLSELKIGTGNIKAVLDVNGIVDVEKSLSKIRHEYSEFGQVKITNKIFDSNELKSFIVNIQQVNGELKETRSFMMSLNGDSFAFPNDIIKGSESYVHHLNAAKNATNQTGEELNANKKRLEEQAKYYSKINENIREKYRLETKLLTSGEKETTEVEKQLKAVKERIKYNEKQLDSKGLRDNSLEWNKNNLKNTLQNRYEIDAAKQLDKASKLESKISAISDNFNNGKYSADLKQMESSLSSFSNLDTKNIQKATLCLEEFRSAYSDIQDHFNGNKVLSNDELMSTFNTIENSSAKFKNAIKEASIDASITKPLTTAFDKVEEVSAKLREITSKDFTKELDRYEGTNGYQRITDSIQKATQAKERLNAEMAKGKDANIDNINADLKVMQSELRKADTQWDRLNASANQLDNIKAGNTTLTWLRNNTKAAKEYGETLEILAQKQKNAVTLGEREVYDRQVKQVISIATSEGKTGNSFLSEAKRAFTQITEFTGLYGISQNLVQEIPRQMVQAVYDVDTAMTELRKVSEASTAQLSQYFDEAASSAKKYGASIDDVISSTADWSRLGYSFEDAKVLSDITTLYQKVGDNMTQQSASESLISTLQGFQLDASEAERIVDKFNEVNLAAS